MRTSAFTSLTSAALTASLFSTIYAYPSILHLPGPLSQYDADVLSKIDQHLARPELATRAASHGKHGHQHFHKRRASSSQAVVFESDTSDVFTHLDHGKRSTGVASPTVSNVNFLGASNNSPAPYYFPNQYPQSLPTLGLSLLVENVIDTVTTGYGFWNGSGNIEITADNVDDLEYTDIFVTISRDTGKGGYLNGTKMFLFSDTQSYMNTTDTSDGEWVGFTSNSAAVDWGNKALNGQPLILRDRPGAFWNEKGTMRNFIPFTLGEQAYNDAMNSAGFRYAIWPSSSIIPMNATSAAVFAPIVFANNNNAQFQYAGATLISITVPEYSSGRSGPIADRLNTKIFPENAPEFGCLGGIRSWGSQGIGGNDGWVYLLTTDKYGILLSRTEIGSIADGSSYQYYYASTQSWSSNMPAAGTDNTFVNGSFSNADIFYSPKHQTFIMVWEDNYIDNKFLWSYLQAPEPLVPVYDGTDFVENIIKYSWSPAQTLYQAAAPPCSGCYIYSAGVQMGYFENEDITNGGSQMLITYTAPTGKDDGSMAGQYSLMSAVVSWD